MAIKRIGLTIRMHREALFITQSQLSELVGCSNKHINQIERGKIFPNWNMLNKIAKALDLIISLRSDSPDIVTLKYCLNCKKVTTHLNGVCVKPKKKLNT